MDIAILGALDRYNYGDLLFPLILKAYLRHSPDAAVTYYGLMAGDFENVGSVNARPFHEFFEKHRHSLSKNVIIVAGGSVIGTRSATLYSFLKNNRALNICRTMCRLLHLPNPADRIAAEKLKITWGHFPFCPPRPNEKSLIIYNAVGDLSIRNPELLHNLQEAGYISVRNVTLFRQWKKHFSHDQFDLCPDSASVMSKIWPKESLKSMISPQTDAILTNFKEGYIVFQAKANMKRKLSTVKHQLEQLYHHTQLPILLLPIGRAPRHEDQLFLSRLADTLKVPCFYADVMNLHDIMCLIAYSNLFIGASLHGNITAMSYAVPHLAVPVISKVNAYLRYWDVPPNNQQGSIKPKQICQAAIKALDMSDRQQLYDNARRLCMLSDKNLKKIASLVENYSLEK